MRDTELFQAALGLSSPWIVLRSEFDPDQKQLDLHIGFARGSRFACPACGAEECGVHDVREREWRHLNFFQHKTVLKASIPRVVCDKCGVKQVSPPWARTGSGFTLLFEAFLLSMVKAMPVANVAEIVDEHDTRLWRVLDHYVSRAVEGLDLSEVEQIAADETSARRGHDYISLFVDMVRRKVVYVADGKDAATVDGFAAFLEAHGGKRENITDASIDMGAAFIAGVKANFPNAKITFDKFHVIMGRVTRARAMASCCCWPPERSPPRRSIISLKTGNRLNISSSKPRRSRGWVAKPVIRFSRTGSSGNISRPCGT